MSMETVEAAVQWLSGGGLIGRNLTIVWHAGEPMVLPVDWYAEALDRIAAHTPIGTQIGHAFQTNGVLVTDAWCDFFRQRKISVGVSLDGPAIVHDHNRKTRQGGGTFKAAMAGFQKLRQAGLSPHVICVVTAQTLAHADEFIDFFEALDPPQLGLNFEETEGIHENSSLDGLSMDSLRPFLQRLVRRSFDKRRPRLREVDQLLAKLRAPSGRGPGRHQENQPFRIVTVDADGGIYTFSPELAGVAVGGFDGRPLGNVHHDPFEDVIAAKAFRVLHSEIQDGVDLCRETCPHFKLCGGGSPSNKLAEFGRFDVSETSYCRVAKKLLGDVILAEVEHRLATKQVIEL